MTYMNKIELDSNTFGSSKAAKILVNILEECGDARLVARVSTFLSEHNMLLNQIGAIPDVHSRLTLINMVGDKIKNSTQKWPERVTTFTKNVAMSKVKLYREMDETIVNECKGHQE